MTSLLPLSPLTLPAASLFVSCYEPFCVTLAQEVRTRGANIFVLQDGEQILGVIRAGYTLLHCIPKVKDAMRLPLIKLLSQRSIDGNKTECISGEAAATAMLLEVLADIGQKPQETRHYILMRLLQDKAFKMMGGCLPTNKFIAICPDFRMADTLMPLEVAYLKEEVIPACRPLSLPATRLSLEKSLRNRHIHAIVDCNGTPIAKAALNAEGFGTVCMGGVFTVPKYRHQGLAQQAVQSVIADAIRAGKAVALYVRQGNDTAQRLYHRMGFVPIGKADIVYY